MAHKNEKIKWKKNHCAYIVFIINTCCVIGDILPGLNLSTSEHVRINFQLSHLIILCCLCFTFWVLLLQGLGTSSNSMLFFVVV